MNAPATDTLVAVAFFASRSRPALTDQREMVLGDLVLRLSHHDRRVAKDGPMFALARYAAGATRGNAGVLEAHGVILDVDTSPTWGLLAPYQYCAFTTHSHTPERPRWRIVLFLATPIAPADWEEAWARVTVHLCPNADPGAKPLSQPHYLPSYPPQGQPETRDHAGALLDWTALPALPPPTPRVRRASAAPRQDRPGDDFSARADWDDILPDWTYLRTCPDGTEHWQRPGKTDGLSATINFGGSDLLYVFTSNAPPLQPRTSYTKFGAYAVLQHGGDHTAAARALAAQGYGAPRPPNGHAPPAPPPATPGANGHGPHGGALAAAAADAAAREDAALTPAAPPAPGDWVPRAWLAAERAARAADQERFTVETRELRTTIRDLEAENGELRRSQPQAFATRLVTQLAPLEAHKPARSAGLPITALLTERAVLVAAGKPADTPLYWDAAERTEQFGRDSGTLRKGLNLLERYAFIDRDYDHLGQPGSGDHRRRVKVTFHADVPIDVPDALNVIRRRVTSEAPRRELPKRSQGCAPCRTAACPDHPKAPVQKLIRTRCTACGRDAAPDHVHAPQAPSRQAPPAIMHLRTAVVDFGPRLKFSVAPAEGADTAAADPAATGGAPRLKFSVAPVAPPPGGAAAENFRATSRGDVRREISVAPPSAAVLDAALAAVDTLATELALDTLPPIQAQQLKLRLYQQVVAVVRAGQPPPTAAALADRCLACDGLLAPGEMVVHSACLAAEGP